MIDSYENKILPAVQIHDNQLKKQYRTLSEQEKKQIYQKIIENPQAQQLQKAFDGKWIFNSIKSF